MWSKLSEEYEVHLVGNINLDSEANTTGGKNI